MLRTTIENKPIIKKILEDFVRPKYNSAGTIQWVKNEDVTNDTYVRRIAVDNNGNSYILSLICLHFGIVLIRKAYKKYSMGCK